VIAAGDLEDVEVVETPDGDSVIRLEEEVIVVPGDGGVGGGVDLTLELQSTLGLEGDVRLHHLHLGGVEDVQGEDISGSVVTHSVIGLTHDISSILPGDVLLLSSRQPPAQELQIQYNAAPGLSQPSRRDRIQHQSLHPQI